MIINFIQFLFGCIIVFVLIPKIIENLQHCTNLDTLNLSHNNIKHIENCASTILPCLTSLNLSNNFLSSLESLEALVDCKTVSVLDLSNNRIDNILVVKILSQMPELRVLILSGNPIVNAIPSYRKTIIIECVSTRCFNISRLMTERFLYRSK